MSPAYRDITVTCQRFYLIKCKRLIMHIISIVFKKLKWIRDLIIVLYSRFKKKICVLIQIKAE